MSVLFGARERIVFADPSGQEIRDLNWNVQNTIAMCTFKSMPEPEVDSPIGRIMLNLAKTVTDMLDLRHKQNQDATLSEEELKDAVSQIETQSGAEDVFMLLTDDEDKEHWDATSTDKQIEEAGKDLEKRLSIYADIYNLLCTNPKSLIVQMLNKKATPVEIEMPDDQTKKVSGKRYVVHRGEIDPHSPFANVIARFNGPDIHELQTIFQGMDAIEVEGIDSYEEELEIPLHHNEKKFAQ